jgi:hypothetical protein
MAARILRFGHEVMDGVAKFVEKGNTILMLEKIRPRLGGLFEVTE